MSSLLLLELVREEQEIVSEGHQEILRGTDAEGLDDIAAAPALHYGLLYQSLGENNLFRCKKFDVFSWLLLQNINSAVPVRTNKSCRVSNYSSYFPAETFYNDLITELRLPEMAL